MKITPRILIVEDEPSVVVYLKSLLRRWNCEVCDVAYTGKEAVTKALEHQPDVILMDIMLVGDTDGIDVAQTIESQLNTHIIFITAIISSVTKKIPEIKSRPLLHKPIDPNQLLQALEKVTAAGTFDVTSSTNHPLRILLVEDNRVTLKIVSSMLKRLGYEIVGMVMSGEEAIQKAEALHPDIILSDVDLMGDMTGLEAAQYIRTHYQIPVVFLTGQLTAIDNSFVTLNKAAFTARDIQQAIEKAIA
ncbi:MAG: response regulator [Gemmatimonadetes bacterium]|nr:MAG: response regulator [Gemmatimonadota bacterium]